MFQKHQQEKVTTKEYHVHGKSFTANSSEVSASKQSKLPETVPYAIARRHNVEPASPEEEIDNAFEVLEKTGGLA